MKSFKWKELLGHHAIFSSLDDKEIEALLADEASDERDFPEGHVIFRERDIGDSIFLIGAGSVQVVLPGRGDHEIILATLRNGEFFGKWPSSSKDRERRR